jgi:Uma2 family endonuclease
MTMAVQPKHRATVADLYRIDGKAELVNGRVIREPPTGYGPSRGSSDIYLSLRQYERDFGGGVAIADNCAFLVDLPERQSFSPDAAWFTGPTTGMKFLEGAPDFAAEVRSEGDYGPAAEQRLTAKRADYFAAGTRVVWDVDLLADEVVRVYRAGQMENPTICRRGEVAEAEPAVPGWRMPVDELFV